MNNSAPKKIYVHVRANKELGTTWHGKKITNNDIEYIRTDAFIEKACVWFRTLDDKEPPYKTTEEFIEGFIKAMKQ